jgi:hypothetical protein
MQANGLYTQQETADYCCTFPRPSQLPFGGDGGRINSNFGSGFPSLVPSRRHHLVANESSLSRTQVPSSLPPTQDPSPESTDALLARELNTLSIQEREKVFEEIHGVDSIEETPDRPELLNQQLAQMDFELTKIHRKSAYLKARIQSPEYVSNREFLLRFLRVDGYNPKDAADRLVSFFDFKLELFGPKKLTEDIKIEDFYSNLDDKAALESGVFQLLPGTDRSRRPIVGKFHHADFIDIPLESKLRVFWYILMAATESELDQKRGIVLMVFNMTTIVNRLETWKNSVLMGTLPVRVNAFHICHNDPKITVLSSLAMIAMGPYYRARLRIHEGT